MVFCKQVKTANWLKERLSSSSSSTDSDSDSTKNSKKITVEVLHGDLTQGARLRALEAFREGQISCGYHGHCFERLGYSSSRACDQF